MAPGFCVAHVISSGGVRGNLLLVHVVRVATADSARGLARFLFGKLAVPDLLVASVAGVSGRSMLLSAVLGAGVAVDTLPRRRVGLQRCAK